MTKIRDRSDVIDSYLTFFQGHQTPGSSGFPDLSPDLLRVAINSMMKHVAPQVTDVINNVGHEREGLLQIDDTTGGLNIFN